MFNKKGVSLITVLLFMLIATIAGTATYKWLSSAQGSSASRMNIAEAQQASNAGLDAVRAWMTYHANDVGAVIRQYIDGGKKPVRLDAVVKAFGSHKQDYSVWLTGADVAAAPYRLKITSVGTARGGAATYSENSILRVNGLYRVKIPEKSMGLHFNDAFAGEHDGITSNDSLQSGLITGDFETNNIPVIYSKMVITGKAKYGGNITHESDVYIAGNLEAHGTITFGTPETIEDFVGYVGGNVECASGQPFTVYGDLYLGGSVTGCKLDVKGNLTVAGNLEVADGSGVAKVKIVPLQFLKAVLPNPQDLGENYEGQTSIGCRIRGIGNDGKEHTYYVYNNCSHRAAYEETGMQGVSYTTGVPAMIGAMMFCKGLWNTPGVHNVEEFDPDPFMEQLNKQGLPWHEIHDGDLEL